MCILQVQHHIQEVLTPEDSPLQQQETETDAVPDDSRLIARQLALFTALLLRWKPQRQHMKKQTMERPTGRWTTHTVYWSAALWEECSTVGVLTCLGLAGLLTLAHLDPQSVRIQSLLSLKLSKTHI